MRGELAILAVLALGCGRLGFDDSLSMRVDGGIDPDGPDAPTGGVTTAYIQPIIRGDFDVFGCSVALSADGSTLAVGAYGEASAATMIDGDATDNSALYAGAVYVFVRAGAAWQQQAYLKTANAGMGDDLGYSLAISADGNTIVASAPDEDGGASSINGPVDEAKDRSGAAYVFARTGTTWAQQAYLKASNSEGGDTYGSAVTISGDGNTIAVGAWLEDCAGNGATDSGAVYILTRAGATWTEQTYLKASNTGANDMFGVQVELSQDGQHLAVSATGEASNATGVNGNELDNSLPQAGAVYLFNRAGSTWSQAAYIKASNADTGDSFGTGIDLSANGAVLVVSAEGEDGSSLGVNGAQVEGAGEAGAVYVFENTGGWTQRAYLKATNTAADDRFGSGVAVASDGATILVGAPQEDGVAIDSGAAYVYRRAGASWTAAYLKAMNAALGDAFGGSVALSAAGQTLAIGALYKSDGGTDNGAVYVIE